MVDENKLPDAQILDLVYSESKDAHAQLLSEVDANHQRADQQVQISLILIGILFATVGSVTTTEVGAKFSATLSPIVGSLILFSALLLAISAMISVYAKIVGRFSSGTIYPHILEARLTESVEAIKADLINSLSRSYYHNSKTLSKKARLIVIAGLIQLAGIFLLFLGIIVIIIPYILQ